jgi:Domain of unknown function (DUF222)
MDTAVTDDRPLDDLVDEICRGAANLTAAEHEWLMLIAEFDRRDGWAGTGLADTASWLCWMVGLDRRAAREKVRVARALRALPLFRAAMAEGQLTYSKARALTRIAVPQNEAELLNLGLAGTSNHVERVVTAYRRTAAVADALDARAHHERSLTVTHGAGEATLRLRLPTEAMTTVLAVIEQYVATVDELGRPAPGISRTELLADAAVAMAEAAHDVDGAPDAGSGADARYLGVVHVGSAGLAETADSEGRCSITTGLDDGNAEVGISVHSARRLLCDAALIRATHEPDGSTNLGRTSRTVSRRLKRQLRIRDGGCRFPGCHRQGWLDAHHIQHWIDHGRTDDDNLLLLCRTHHRLLHEGRWTISGSPNGHVTFHDALGRPLAIDPPRFLGSAAAVDRCARSASDGRSRWDGTRLDLDAALDQIIHPLPVG